MPTNWQHKLLHEIRAVGLATLYFGLWLAVLLLIKQLILAEYRIEFSGISKALIGALILSKVVIVMERVSLEALIARQPAWVGVLLRTLLYALGVLVVLVLEKGFEGRDEYGGFVSAVAGIYAAEDAYHIAVNAIVLTGALLVYNLLAVIRHHLGEGGLLRILTTPLPQDGLNADRPDPGSG